MNADLFTDEPAPTSDSLFTDEPIPQEKSLGGFAHNAWQDVKDTGAGIANLGKGLLTHPIDTATNVATGIGPALFNEGKRLGVGELLTGHPINATEKFGEALYEKPLTTTLDVLPAAGAAGKVLGIGGEAAKGAEMASEAAQGTKAAEELGQVAGKGAAVGAAEAVPTGATFQETVANIGKKIPGAIKEPLEQANDFLNKKYAQVAQKPHWRDILSDYMKEHGQNMDLKEMGAAPGQVRKIGVDKARALADYAAKEGLVGPKIGTIGRERLVPQLMDESGGAVGAFRKMASDRGAVHNVDELIDKIRGSLDQKYVTPDTEFKGPGGEIIKSGGVHSGESGKYFQALSQIKRSGGRADEMADTISDLFKEAKNADRLKQPSGPFSDVARAARELNHKAIAGKLSPEELAVYEHGLENYGALTQIAEFIKRRASTEAGGRLGPGSGISRAAVQKFLDSVGYRTEAKIMRNLSEKIRANPDIAARPQNLFRHYIDEAADAIDEMTEAAQ